MIIHSTDEDIVYINATGFFIFTDKDGYKYIATREKGQKGSYDIMTVILKNNKVMVSGDPLSIIVNDIEFYNNDLFNSGLEYVEYDLNSDIDLKIVKTIINHNTNLKKKKEELLKGDVNATLYIKELDNNKLVDSMITGVYILELFNGERLIVADFGNGTNNPYKLIVRNQEHGILITDEIIGYRDTSNGDPKWLREYPVKDYTHILMEPEKDLYKLQVHTIMEQNGI